MNEKFEIFENNTSELILNKGIAYADAFVNKNYLINLDAYPVIPLKDKYKSSDDINKLFNKIRLYRIEKIVYDAREISNDKLISVYSALSNIEATSLLIIDSNKEEISFYLGVRSEENTVASAKILEKSLRGNFPGSKMVNINNSNLKNILGSITESNHYNNLNNVVSVSIVPSSRDKDKNKFVQGIENFVESMEGEDYTAIFISTPLNKHILEQRKRGLSSLYSNLSSFAGIQLSYGENTSESITKGISENFSKTLNESLSDTISNSESYSRTVSKGKSSGSSYSLLGLGSSMGRSTSISKGYSSGSSWAKAITKGESTTEGETINYSDSTTHGNSRTMTINYENKLVKSILEKIEQHLDRIKQCESFGLWDTACYFVSKDIQTAVVAANTYKALMAGDSSGVENSFINIWKSNETYNTQSVLEYLQLGMHPNILIPKNEEIFDIEEQLITPASLISGNEIPLIMGLPKKSVSGLTVLSMAEFGRNIVTNSKQNEKNSDFKELQLGHIYHMGEDKENNKVKLNIDNLTSHCFVTGSTGSGKSNTIYKILDEIIKEDIPFLVIEPAKGEYKRYYGNLQNINIFCTNPKYFSMLKINPFKFNQEIHVLEHLDRLIDIFNACWPLYAAMPSILKQSFEEAYIKCGWDLNKSIHIPNGNRMYPTFEDVLEILPKIINSSEYSSDSKGDYIGALVTRVKSLTNGIVGQIMCDSSDISDKQLFDENTIVDLSRISSLETKSLIMGILILKLNEYRLSSGLENQPLRHVVVLEEAHNILKRSTGSSLVEGNDLQGKSVKMISSSIAEMRTFGEGFIIVDQSPTAVDVSAIKNTNTKIIMKLPDYEDCEIAGKSIGLNDIQIREISKLPTGVAVVYQNNWVESVLTKIGRSYPNYYKEDVICLNENIAQLKGILASMLIISYESSNYDEFGFELVDLIEVIAEYEISDFKKKEIIVDTIEFVDYFAKEATNNANFSNKLSKFIDCDGLFNLLNIKFVGKYEGLKNITKNTIDKNDIRSIKQWYEKLYKHIDKYAYIENKEIKEKLIRYIIFNQKYKHRTINKYNIIDTVLYG